jgi:dTDP-4-amino-4,6-dideoxygalactose transaminase
VSDRILLSPPDVGPLEETYVLDALQSGWVAPLGPHVEAFEREVAHRVGCGHALALASGTAGLHLAMLTLGAGPGDVVVVPTLTFVATANAVVYAGAEPVFVDCEAGTGNLDPALLDELLSDLRSQGRRVAAVVPVDMFGSCVDYTRVLPVCAEAGVPVVEDAAEALGSTRDGQAAGSFGRAAVLSFNGNKIITTSGGGMLVSDDADLIARCRYLSTQARQPVSHYEHIEVGYNYRLSNVLAALGRAQLRRLDEIVVRRRRLRERYAKLFAAFPGVRLLADDDAGANCWLTAIVVDPAAAGWQAADLAAHLDAYNIEARPIWKPMHLQPVFAGARALLTGAAQRLFENGLTLPSGTAMTESQVVRVLNSIEQFLSRPMPRRQRDSEINSAN